MMRVKKKAIAVLSTKLKLQSYKSQTKNKSIKKHIKINSILILTRTINILLNNWTLVLLLTINTKVIKLYMAGCLIMVQYQLETDNNHIINHNLNPRLLLTLTLSTNLITYFSLKERNCVLVRAQY